MRILFDLRSTGLGRNGGSKTIVESSNTLLKLGVDVILVDSGKPSYDFTPINAKHMIVRNTKDIPGADFIIATGYDSVSHTVDASERCGKKLHWLRGWELWRMSEKKIVKEVLEAPTTKIVNSIGLQKKLLSYRHSSYLIRPGHDFDELYPTNERGKNNKIVIGGIYNKGTKRKTKRVEWIFEVIQKLKNKFENIELWMFGADGMLSTEEVNEFFFLPNLEKKNAFYNKVDIWLSPTELDSLAIVPAEAMLTECCVLGTNAPLNGMIDYLEHKKTGYVSENNLEDFIKGCEELVLDKDLRTTLGRNGRKKILSLGDRKDNMKKLTELLMSF